MRKFILAIGVLIIIICLISVVIIYFDNWDRILSNSKEFELYRLPIIGLVVGGLIVWGLNDDIRTP